ncbi:LysR family transcriptional regulator [Bradyrhizobium sp. KB893862 SZCCT0404]|uniref:LysR family transcriptional regulator n=1 Tax=Bradyrhizobium sp. KB893862 SZCCT0404 TaxID=2807672 RepID=UPI001BA524BD|nr:LysR family transcriptional regulator [Bradyrhizobium sp. KB893862 SZCCT0404]MBR1177175.1 LysR family transcriptional regulator [Bradyrhizobium sp. KB893862 SZCCT0404]
MLDGVSLDQLRTFVVAAEAGSFSAAARKLSRAQSMVSELVSNLEGQLGVALFDRSGRYPKLTAEGGILLADARNILAGVEDLKTRASGMSSGLEPELSVVVDVFFPIEAITETAREFEKKFPTVPLRLYVEALGSAYQPVMDGRATVGVVGSLPLLPPGLMIERLLGVAFVMVAARDHPLASVPEPIPKRELGRHTQLVLTDRSELSAGREFGVMSGSTWRLADLSAKHAFLLNGLGWGGMPAHTVAGDMAEGRLVELTIEDGPPGGFILQMSAIYPIARAPGPAGRWFIEHLRTYHAGYPATSRKPVP